jgi:hypothetical protein
MLSVAGPPVVEPVDVTVTNPVLPVEVSNADPIPVSVVQDSAASPEGAREVFRKTVSVDFGNGSGNCNTSDILTVPSGKRAVIQNISGSAFLTQPAKLTAVSLRIVSDPLIFVPAAEAYPITTIANSYYASFFGQQTHIYTDQSVRICAESTAPSRDSATVTVNGYYVQK